MPGQLIAPFATFGLSEAKQTIGAAVLRLTQQVNIVPVDRDAGNAAFLFDAYGANPLLVGRAFLNGDHWQGGLGWVGPRPQLTDLAYTETMSEIARMFVSKNVIKEIVQRHVNGVVGIEPHFGLTSKAAIPEDEDPPEAIVTLVDEGEALLTRWWDVRKVHAMIQRAVQTLTYAERAMLRLYVPKGMLVDGEMVDSTGRPNGTKVKMIEAASIEDALFQIYVDHPLPEMATIAQDEDSKEYIGCLVFTAGRDVTGIGKPVERAEITFLTGDRDNPQTVIRATGPEGSRDYAFAFGGRLPMFEMTRPVIVTPQMWQSQKALNLALSMQPRNIVTAGFLERTILNAQMPGKWELDERGNRTKFVPEPYYSGAATTNFLTGVELRDPETGKVQLATPSIHTRDPVAASPLIETARSHYADMLEEGSQEHTLAYQNSQSSGKTHEQARADFTTSLRTTQSTVEPMGRWLIETLLAMAEEMSGSTGYFTETLRGYFTCRLDTGPISAEERTANDGSVKAGTLSVESAIVRNGETDPDAELARLQAQPGSGLPVIERQTTVILQLTQAGASLKGAAKFAGLEDGAIRELVGDGVPAPVPTGPDGKPVPQ